MGCATSTAVAAEQEAIEEMLVAGGLDVHHRYVFEGKLGQGHFGVVYCATKLDDHEAQVAIKVVDVREHTSEDAGFDCPGVVSDLTKTNMLRSEIRMMRVLRGHINVCNILESHITGGLAYIVMEKLDRTLTQALELVPDLNEATLGRFLWDMLSGLAFVHSRGIVHRDVKPANFMCGNPEDTVKLCDFGMSRALRDPSERTCTGVAGTRAFMAPEMANNQNYGVEVDVWAFGVILYTMCFGNLPYMTGSPTDDESILAAIGSGSHQPSFKPNDEDWGDISEELMKLVRRCLARDPDLRATSAEAVGSCYFTSPSASSVCMRPRFEAAKSTGAFGGVGKHTKNWHAVEGRLEVLQERNQAFRSKSKMMSSKVSEASTAADTPNTSSPRSGASGR